MKHLHVKRSREYHPHHTLLGAAGANLDLAKNKEPGWHYFEMAAILFSGLAIEALANSFGETYVPNWKDFESSSPIAKIQIVAKSMGADFDETKATWSHVRWLIKFRNKLAHAKPEFVTVDRTMPEAEWDKERMKVPNSKIENEITLGNAERAVEAACSILEILCDGISKHDLNSLRADGWSSTASMLIPGDQPA